MATMKARAALGKDAGTGNRLINIGELLLEKLETLVPEEPLADLGACGASGQLLAIVKLSPTHVNREFTQQPARNSP
jgi:hypothetical protein